MSSLANSGIFLIQTIFNLYLIVILLRIILQKSGASFYNPISQFVIRCTNPVLIYLRKYIPAIHGFDLAAVGLVVVVEVVKLLLMFWLVTQSLPNPIGLILWLIADLLSLIVTIYFYAIIISAILSWFRLLGANPIYETLYLVTEPLLRPLRKIIPIIAGLDLSPLAALILLKLFDILIVQNLLQLALGMLTTNPNALML